MALHPDVSDAVIKVARARKHLEDLKSEIHAWYDKHDPWPLEQRWIDSRPTLQVVTREDPAARDPKKLQELAGIAGDVYNNLRSALDYCVTELVRLDGVDQTTKHAFPIFIDRQRYASTVWDGINPPPKRSPLFGISNPMTLAYFRNLQPFNQLVPNEDHLWHLHRFVNADKHRDLTVIGSLAGPAKLRIKGTWLSKRFHKYGFPRTANANELELGQVLFARPLQAPRTFGVSVEALVLPTFAVPATSEFPAIRHHISFLYDIHGRVDRIVGAVGQL